MIPHAFICVLHYIHVRHIQLQSNYYISPSSMLWDQELTLRLFGFYNGENNQRR